MFGKKINDSIALRRLFDLRIGFQTIDLVPSSSKHDRYKGTYRGPKTRLIRENEPYGASRFVTPSQASLDGYEGSSSRPEYTPSRAGMLNVWNM